MLPVHVVWMQLDLNGLPEQLIHVSGFGGQDLGVLEMDMMSAANAKFSYGRFVWMSHTNVPVVLLDPVTKLLWADWPFHWYQYQGAPPAHTCLAHPDYLQRWLLISS
jgi:hypothetical protein